MEIVVAMDWTDFDRDGQATLRAQSGDPARPGDAAFVADRLEGRTDGAAQRFRGRLPRATEATRARPVVP